uniref:hypothetical protein n=1 Tax=Clostridium sp. UBA5119 TaxID=1946366 RepID=UPI0032163854
MLVNYIEGKRAFNEEIMNVHLRYYNPVNGKDPNGFRPIYTQGEETDAMRDASYEAMAKAAPAISNKLGSISTSKSKSSSGFILSVVTAVADSVIGSKIASKLGTFSKYREWTYN